MPWDRIHGGVCFRMSDLKLLAPVFLDEVLMGGILSRVTPESTTDLVPKALANSHLCNQGWWQMPRCVTKWSGRREGFVTDGFLDIWGLSSSELGERWARPWTGADVVLTARAGSEVRGPCLWASCCCSAGGLARQHRRPEVWWGNCGTVTARRWETQPGIWEGRNHFWAIGLF